MTVLPPLRIRVRLFAMQREIAGTRELRLEVPVGATVEDAWAAVVGVVPALAPGRASLRFARQRGLRRRRRAPRRWRRARLHPAGERRRRGSARRPMPSRPIPAAGSSRSRRRPSGLRWARS